MNIHIVNFFFYLISYSFEFTYRFTEPYIVCFPLFDPWLWQWNKLPYSCKFISDLFFVRVYGDNCLSCIIKHWTTPPCYFTIYFTPCLSYTNKKSSPLLILKGSPLRLIVRFINTSFHIHFLLFIIWKQNFILILLNCCRWSSDFFDVNLVEEYKLSGFQWRKMSFILIRCYRPDFHILPFLISKQYGEGRMSLVLIFFSLLFLRIFPSNYYLS